MDNNRANAYGDAFFESILCVDSKIPLWRYHWRRIEKTIQYLAFEPEKEFSEIALHEKLLTACGADGQYRLRVAFSRNNGGYYLPTDNRFQISIESNLIANDFQWIHEHKVDWVYWNAPIATNQSFFNYKTANALPYVLAAIAAKTAGVTECILLNTMGRPIEWISSNLFVIKNGQLYTPPLSEGCLDGVLRRSIIEYCKLKAIKCLEQPLEVDFLAKAEALLMTNAIKGVTICPQTDKNITWLNEMLQDWSNNITNNS